MRLEGRKILVTGAASGIGFATAKVFLREGANVALLDHNRDGLASAVAHLSGGSRQIASALADVTSEAELAMAVVDASSPLVRELRDLDKLVGVAAFREYQFEWPERICMDAVLDAERLGAVVRNYTPVKRLAREGDDWRITLGDAIDSAAEANVTARVVLNMAGIWIDRVNRAAGEGPKRKITGTKGAHIRVQLPPDCADNGVATINRLHEPFWRRDVIFTWAGLRPLTYDPALPKGPLSNIRAIATESSKERPAGSASSIT